MTFERDMALQAPRRGGGRFDDDGRDGDGADAARQRRQQSPTA
jgi:hypothetical protein